MNPPASGTIFPLLVFHPGIWTWVSLPKNIDAAPQYNRSLRTKLETCLEHVATETIFPFDEDLRARVPTMVRLYWSNTSKTIYTLPTSRWPQLRDHLNNERITYQEPQPNPANTASIWFDTENAFRGMEKSINRNGIPILFDPLQREACLQIAQSNTSMRIEMPMGAAKSLILAWIIFALKMVVGAGGHKHEALRPLVLAGKNIADTKQLYETLQLVLQANSEWRTPANHLCLQLSGRRLKRTDKLLLQQGNGILVTTHKSLHNIPLNSKCILLDEEHAAATPAVLAKLMRHSQKCLRIYGATATPDMRPDKADRLLRALIGPVLLRQNFRQYEEHGRVAPIHLHIYPFTGMGPYQHDPHKPYRQPWGSTVYQALVENHHGRHQFVAELLLSLPPNETKVMFIPTITHAQKILAAVQALLQLRINQKAITLENAQSVLPVIIHSQGSNQTNSPQNAKQIQKALVADLLQGKLKSAIVTDFLATGVDTNQIDHIIDACGQAAKATNIQRSGRAGRPRRGKIAKLHIIKDEHQDFFYRITNAKLEAYAHYYGFLKDHDVLATTLNERTHQSESRVFLHPEGAPSYKNCPDSKAATEETKPNISYIFVSRKTLFRNLPLENTRALRPQFANETTQVREPL